MKLAKQSKLEEAKRQLARQILVRGPNQRISFTSRGITQRAQAQSSASTSATTARWA